MAVGPVLESFTRFARRNPLTLMFVVGGVLAVGWWLSGLEGRIESRTATVIRERVDLSAPCAEHRHSKRCLESIRHGLERCLEDLNCSAVLASAPHVNHQLRETARAVHEVQEQAGPAPKHEGSSHHATPAPTPSHGHEGGGHPGSPGSKPHQPEEPAVPEPTQPSSPTAPEATPPEPPSASQPSPEPAPATPSTPKPELNVCAENPLLPICIRAGLGGVGVE